MNKQSIISMIILLTLAIIISGCQTKKIIAQDTPSIIVEDVPKETGDTSMPKTDNNALIDRYADTTNIDTSISEIKQVE